MKRKIIYGSVIAAALLIAATGTALAAVGQAVNHHAASVTLGHACHTLSLDAGVSTANGWTEPSVCVVRDLEGKRFYLLSGVFAFTATSVTQQVASFDVSDELPLYGSTMLPLIGAGNAYAVIQPSGVIELHGLTVGCAYVAVSVSGSIPVAVPADEQAP